MQNILAEVIILVKNAYFLDALVVHEIFDSSLHLIAIGGKSAKLQLVIRLIHFICGGYREDIHHTHFERAGHRHHIGGRAESSDKRKYLVFFEKLVARLRGLVLLIGGIFDDEFDHTAINATLLVHFIDSHAHSVCHRYAP